MQLEELYQLIGLQSEIVQKLEKIYLEIDLTKIDKYLDQLMDISTAPMAYQYLTTFFQGDRDNLYMLYCQLECARHIFEKYQEKQIPRVVFIDTMKCFPRFIKECGKKNGRLFFDRGWWTYRQISMNLFRIGSLEYQFQEHLGEMAIGIHIPSDGDLSKEAVDASLRQAALFFHTYYDEYKYKQYICDSWLLSPVLRRLLPDGSNILAFQQRFTIMREDKSDREYIEWLFQVPEGADYHSLPEITDLQKKAKRLLLDGGTIGSAYGIMKSLSS